MTGMENFGRKRVEAGHHEVRWWIVGFLDDVGNLTVLIGVTDAVA